MVLYHATFCANLNSIEKNGLGGAGKKINWEEVSSPEYTYFTNDLDYAVSFCEAAPDVDDDIYDSGIVVLAVESDVTIFEKDENIKDEDDASIVVLKTKYIIPFSKLKIIGKYDT